MEFHPLANLFPLLEGEEFARLCADIKANDLVEPIWTYQEQILDGRNRYRACGETNTAPRFREYDGSDPVGFVVSLNLHRRHLNESQRAMVAAKIANLSQGARTDLPSIEGRSQADAAKLMNIGVTSVERAAKVQKEAAPEVVEAVESGTVAVSAAVLLTELPKEQQREALTSLIKEAGGGKITSSRIEKAVKVLTGETTNVHVSDDSYEWYTPMEYVEAARAVMGEIDLDPASSAIAQETVKAHQFYTKEDDGLSKAWMGRVWLNPPYSADLVREFVSKLKDSREEGLVEEAILLVNNATDTRWFQDLLSQYPVCFTAGRVKFWGPGKDHLAARQGQAFIYFGENESGFKAIFSHFGTVVAPL